MTYARFPDELIHDDAYLEAVDRHVGAGTVCMFSRAYSAGKGTDGFVPDRQLRRFVQDPEQLRGALEALVAVGLFVREDDGYRMTDYLDDNMSADEYRSKRDEQRERKRRERKRRAEEAAEREAQRSEAEDVTQGVTRDTPVTDEGRPHPVTAVSSRVRAQNQTRNQNQTTANAAATPRAGAHEPTAAAPTGGGGDGNDLGDHAHLPQAQAALVAAGFTTDDVAKAVEVRKINQSLHGNQRPITDWAALGAWLAAERTPDDQGLSRCRAVNPSAALRYALNSHTQAGARRPAGPGTSRPPKGAAPRPRVVDLPQPAQDVSDAWTALRESFNDLDGASRFSTLVAAVHPVALDGAALTITSQPGTVGYVEQQLLPHLQRHAQATGAQVRWVDPIEAAGLPAVAA